MRSGWPMPTPGSIVPPVPFVPPEMDSLPAGRYREVISTPEAGLMLRLLMCCGLATVLSRTAGAVETDDPFLWLEDVGGDRALVWVKEQNARSVQELTQGTLFAELNERLLTILDSNARIPYVSKHGAHYYNFWQDAQRKRGIWRRTTLDEYQIGRAHV